VIGAAGADRTRRAGRDPRVPRIGSSWSPSPSLALAGIGASVVLLAGYGLAASGIVLAGLIGLVVAGLTVDRERTWRTT
jgi:hypothetical protein